MKRSILTTNVRMEQSKKVGPPAATAAPGLSPQYVGFDFRPFYIAPGLNKGALGQGFLRVRTCFRFPLSLSFHHCCILIYTDPYYYYYY